MRKKGWSREFDDPIDLPRGRNLVKLEGAGNYVTMLPTPSIWHLSGRPRCKP
jgi:hypothetical protein